jgi:hypothetical protein
MAFDLLGLALLIVLAAGAFLSLAAFMFEIQDAREARKAARDRGFWRFIWMNSAANELFSVLAATGVVILTVITSLRSGVNTMFDLARGVGPATHAAAFVLFLYLSMGLVRLFSRQTTLQVEPVIRRAFVNFWTVLAARPSWSDDEALLAYSYNTIEQQR